MTPNGSAGVPFTARERRALLDEFFALSDRLDKANLSGLNDQTALDRYAQLRRTYREKLPILPLSRCPFTRNPYLHSIDPFGIDGPWWDYRAPNRPLELLGGNIVAFTGAMRLGAPLEAMPFLCRPGPAVPFVVPRILEREGVRAVISSRPIGAHTGYIIVYFANPAPADLEGFNDWGADDYQFESDTDQLGWDKVYVSAADYDFELGKWLADGKLLWIAPEDAELILREGADGCPYVGLDGIRKPQLVQDGEVWHEELWSDETVPSEPAEAVPLTAQATAANPQEGLQPPGSPATESSGSACGSCGTILPANARFCSSCGSPVLPPMPAAPVGRACPSCGQPVLPTAKFCKGCGHKLT
jgi:hypothetical protein